MDRGSVVTADRIELMFDIRSAAAVALLVR